MPLNVFDRVDSALFFLPLFQLLCSILRRSIDLKQLALLNIKTLQNGGFIARFVSGVTNFYVSHRFERRFLVKLSQHLLLISSHNT